MMHLAATLAQLIGLAGVVVGAVFVAGVGGGVIGGAAVLIYVGLAMERGV